MHNFSDQQLISAYLKGDEKALEILIKRYLKPIYGFVYRYVGNAQNAEDISQEVFLKTWRNLKKPAPYRIYSGTGFDSKKGSFKSWIFAIAKNASLDFLRKKQPLSLSEFDNFADFSPLPDKIAEGKSIKNLLALAIKKLSAKYRLILSLYYNDCLNFREIAQMSGESLNTVKSRHRRGLVFLRKLLAKT